MERIKTLNIQTSDLEQFEKEAFIEIKKDKEFYGMLLDCGFDDSAIKKYLGQCHEYFNDFKKWKSIKTIDDVRNTGIKYIYKLLFSDGEIYRINEMTEPYKEYNLYRSKFIFKDFDDQYNDVTISKIDNTNLKLKLKDAVSHNSWIYLTGAISTGRTYASIALINGSAKKGFKNLAFINASNRFKELADASFHDKEYLNNTLTKLKDAHLLVVDGFGNEYITEPLRDNIIIPLLLDRAANKRMTIFTSDFTLDQIIQMYSKKDPVKGSQLGNILKSMIKKEISTGKNSLY